MRVYLDTVGCRLNQAEIEGMAGQFRAAGHEIVATADQADLAVVNTCTVTAQAAADSRAMLRRTAAGGVRRIVATGCWATLRPAEAAALPSVVGVVPNDAKAGLVPGTIGMHPAGGSLGGVGRQPIPGVHHRTRAFIKAQDGCDNHCTFCVTTIARGRGQSRSWVEVVADVRDALRGGAKEIVLTGVHLGSWGADLGLHLSDLVRAVLNETDAPRVRLSSLEPWDIDPKFFELWKNRRLCRHFHLPVQSGCAATLKRMARRTTPDSFRALVHAARSLLPDAAITTDVIACFPGETEIEFRSSLDFVREMEFAGGHAFTYSPMIGTAAARMPAQVLPGIQRARTRQYLELFERSGRAFRAGQLGSRRLVLWESAAKVSEGTWTMGGQTDNYIRVRAEAPTPRWNEIDAVVLRNATRDKVQGIIVESG
jgi:threonylcarbamoyladenosine tRNA methylthiotransferase MtaB